MKLNKIEILNTANAVKNGIVSEDKLKELIGGQRLYDIFEDYTVKAIIRNIIDLGKFHNQLKDVDGFDMLEGFLNNTIFGNLQDFYMIRPDYILRLPKKQKINMAKSISGGNEELSMALQYLWSKGIRTEACTTRNSDNTPMIQVRIKDTDFIQQDIIQQIYNQGEFSYTGNYNDIDRDFMVRIFGDNLYECINGLKNSSNKTDKAIFKRIFDINLLLGRLDPADNIASPALQRKILIEERSLTDQQFAKKHNNTHGKQHKNSTNLPIKQGRISKFLSQIRAKFFKKTTITCGEEEQQDSDTVEIEKKSWELDPMNKLDVQRNIAEIVEKQANQKGIKPQGKHRKSVDAEK